MIKVFIILISVLIYSQASELRTKYEVYSEYLGLKILDLKESQLKKIVPKLEAKMKKDPNYKKIVLQNKLQRLNSIIKPVEQTICFSKNDCNAGFYAVGSLGEQVNLCGGKCQGKTLIQMNQSGWELIQVVSGLSNSFGMVLIRK